MNIYVVPFVTKTLRITLRPKLYALIEIFQQDLLIGLKKYDVGDMAEYSKSNMSFFGPITNITRKNIIIKTVYGHVKHLSPSVFGWHNWDFDPITAASRNLSGDVGL